MGFTEGRHSDSPEKRLRTKQSLSTPEKCPGVRGFWGGGDGNWLSKEMPQKRNAEFSGPLVTEPDREDRA